MYLDIILTVFAILLVLFAARILVHKGWIAGFLRGMSGVVLVGSAGVIGLVALDLYGYKRMLKDERIATVSFEKNDHQNYTVTLVPSASPEPQVFVLSGDQWQLDARVIRWHGLFKVLAGKPGYRLDRLSGRYLSLEDERNKPRTVHEIEQSTVGIDFWAWSRKISENTTWVDATYGSAAFVPMAHGALYEVAVSESGLVAKPLNPAAQTAINMWR